MSVPRVPLPGPQAQERSDVAALREAVGIVEGEEGGQGGQRTDARGLSQLLGHGVAIFAKAFDLSIDRVDLPGQLLDRAQDRSQPREEILPDAVAYALRKCFRRARRQPRAQ